MEFELDGNRCYAESDSSNANDPSQLPIHRKYSRFFGISHLHKNLLAYSSPSDD